MAESVAPASIPHTAVTRRLVRPAAARVHRRESRPSPATAHNPEPTPLLASRLFSQAPTPAGPPYCFHPGLRSGSAPQPQHAPAPNSNGTEPPRAPHRARASIWLPLFHRLHPVRRRALSSHRLSDSRARPPPAPAWHQHWPASLLVLAHSAPYQMRLPIPSFPNQSPVISWKFLSQVAPASCRQSRGHHASLISQGTPDTFKRSQSDISRWWGN